MGASPPDSSRGEIVRVLGVVSDVIQDRHDLLPPVTKCIAKMTVDLTYLIGNYILCVISLFVY